MNDPVKNPSHYQFENACLEVRDVIRDRLSLLAKEYSESPDFVGTISYDYSNAIKYLLRAFFKNRPIEDLNKAKYCINTLLGILTSKQAATNQSVECESDISATVYDETLGTDIPNLDLCLYDVYKEKMVPVPVARFKGQGW